jgi:hypothetical protein
MITRMVAWVRSRLGETAATAMLAALLVGQAPAARAMEIKMTGHQVVLSGPVIGDEFDKVQKILADDPTIDTAILRNSPGGDAPTGYRIGELFRAKGLRTAVSGYCYSSCSRMFLGGMTRYFTDDFPPEYTHVGFHGHYDDCHLNSEAVERRGLKNWIIKYSDGKADPALVERWINIPLCIGMTHFYHPGLLQRGGVSTFMCQGNEPMAQSVIGCEPIHKTALDLGIVTSLTIVKSEDQAQVRASFPKRPKASGFAAIQDIAKVPLHDDAARQGYKRFLAATLPRAFALSPDGRTWAQNSGGSDAISPALTHCAQLSKQTCKLYAVDDDVVWKK